MTAKTPTALKVATGTPGTRAINKKEPKPQGKLTQPKTLSPLASTLWKRVVQAMPDGVFTQADEAALVAYCEAYANLLTATAEINRVGIFSTGSQGQTIVHPAVRIQADSSRIIASLGARIGFDPISRSNIVTDEEEAGDDPFSGLIN